MAAKFTPFAKPQNNIKNLLHPSKAILMGKYHLMSQIHQTFPMKYETIIFNRQNCIKYIYFQVTITLQAKIGLFVDVIYSSARAAISTEWVAKEQMVNFCLGRV